MKYSFACAATLLSSVCALGAATDAKQLFSAIRNNDLTVVKSLAASAADVNVRGERQTTPLMYAGAFGSLEAMRVLMDAGADVNAHNDFNATALMWSVNEPAKVQLLVEHGANVNAKSKTGRTPLMLAAMQPGSDEVVDLLLKKGADPLAVDEDGMTFLAAASNGFNPRQVRLALKRGADANQQDSVGLTPLMNATANGDLESVKLLLQHHADVNLVSKPESSGKVKNGPIQLGKFTALLLATAYGPPELVQELLDAGAKTDARDVRGMTALHFAVSSESQDPKIVKLLLKAGVDPAAKTNAGETAAEWAAKFGHPEITALLPTRAAEAKTVSLQAADQRLPASRAAAERSLKLLQQVSGGFIATGGCMSCHGQNLTALVVSQAKKHGYAVDDGGQQGQLMGTRAFFASAGDRLLLQFGPGGGADTINYTLWHLSAAGYQPDQVSDSLIYNIAGQQLPDGRWHRGGVARPPIEDSDIVVTALSLRAFKSLGWKGREADLDQKIVKARHFLATAKPRYSEDAVMQILGLHWAGDALDAQSAKVRTLLAKQKSDGGWGQNDFLDSDAYATGQSLYALVEAAGVPPTDPAVQRGVQYLLRTQLPDGSWHVKSRAAKFQPYFQSGFPHDHDQWISMAGTAWATLALVNAGEPVKVAER